MSENPPVVSSSSLPSQQPAAPRADDEPVTSAASCVRRLSALLQLLEAAGLQLQDSAPPVPEAVEQILITDTWDCSTCGLTEQRNCPTTGRPHRRHLVRVAQDLLRLLGSTAGHLVARPPDVASRVRGRVTRKLCERRVKMNPQALLLAYYYAALPPRETDPVLHESAMQLVGLLEQLRRCGASETPREEYAAALLSSASLTWREYSRAVAADLRAVDASDRRASAAALVDGTRRAYRAAVRELRRCTAADGNGSSSADLLAFVAALRNRLAVLAPEMKLDTLGDDDDDDDDNDEYEGEDKLDEYEKNAQGEAQGATIHPTNGESGTHEKKENHAENRNRKGMTVVERPLLRDANTSGSEAEPDPPAAMGPALPPDWYVDATGRSRPPVSDPQQRAAEAQERLRYRARMSYRTVVQVPERQDDPQAERLAATLGDASLAVLAEQCNQRPPDLRGVVQLLNAVVDGLLNALPRRLRGRVEQEVRDVLDWRIVRRSVMGSPANIAVLMQYVMGKVAEYGAPARADETLRGADAMRRDLETCTPDLGMAVANAFRLMLVSIRQLHEDVAHYSLLSITPQLRDNAVTYVREFITECLPPLTEWESSIAFLRKHYAEERTAQHAASPAAVSATALSESERRLRSTLMFGALDLLRSSGRKTADRWHGYPTECFFFENTVIFFSANALQEGTLLLLLSASISTVLRGKGIDSRTVNDILKRLHDRFLRVLTEEASLPHLKTSVTGLVDEALADIDRASPLSQLEIAQLHGTIDKMTDTNGSLYATFEKRILQFIEATLAQGKSEAAPLGLVTDSLRRVATLLDHMLTFNWEVYHPFYQEMLPLITQNGDDDQNGNEEPVQQKH